MLQPETKLNKNPLQHQIQHTNIQKHITNTNNFENQKRTRNPNPTDSTPLLELGVPLLPEALVVSCVFPALAPYLAGTGWVAVEVGVDVPLQGRLCRETLAAAVHDAFEGLVAAVAEDVAFQPAEGTGGAVVYLGGMGWVRWWEEGHRKSDWLSKGMSLTIVGFILS